jgi:HK97 family phage portal protein
MWLSRCLDNPELAGASSPRMGILEALRSRWMTTASERPIGEQIAWAVEARELGLSDYLALPAVARARQLIVSLIAELEPVAYRNGYPIPEQPKVLVRPGPEITRQEWLAQLAGSLVDYGNAVLWLPRSGRDAAGRAEIAVVLPYGEVHVEWADDSRLSRKYGWRERELFPGRDIIHIAIGRRAGDLEGTSPIAAIADSLVRLVAAEIYAGDWFTTGAVPSVTLKYEGTLTDAGAADVKARWIENHQDHSPAVLPKGWDLKETGADPQASQLLETRRWGVSEVARGLGIFPPELLLAEGAGSSLTYQNIAEALMTFVRVTVQPVYLAPIEEGLSDLVPGTQAVRMNTSELERLGTAQRWAAYATGLGAGFITPEQIDRWEGWDRSVPEPLPAPLAPTPSPTAMPEVAA